MEAAELVFQKGQLLVVGWVLGVVVSGLVYFLGFAAGMALWPFRRFTKEAERVLP